MEQVKIDLLNKNPYTNQIPKPQIVSAKINIAAKYFLYAINNKNKVQNNWNIGKEAVVNDHLKPSACNHNLKKKLKLQYRTKVLPQDQKITKN